LSAGTPLERQYTQHLADTSIIKYYTARRSISMAEEGESKKERSWGGLIVGRTGAGRAGRVTVLAVVAALSALNSNGDRAPSAGHSPRPDQNTVAGTGGGSGEQGFIESGTEFHNLPGREFCGGSDKGQNVRVINEAAAKDETWLQIAAVTGELATRDVPFFPDCTDQPWIAAKYLSPPTRPRS
jgi:hypothetical protein